MNCCGRLYRCNVGWLSRCLQTLLFHNGRSSSCSLKMYDRSYPLNNTYSGLISRQFGTSQLLNKGKRSEETKEALQKYCLNFLENSRNKDLVAKLENFEYFQSKLSKLEKLGLSVVNRGRTAACLKLSEQLLDHYLNKLSELQDAGFSADRFGVVFKPFKYMGRITYLPDIEQKLRHIETLQVKYGLSAEQIEVLAIESLDLEELIEKMEILKLGGFPDHLDYRHYGILFQLSTPVLRDFFNDLQESGHSEYGVADLKKHLEEKNYGIENIELLSELTGVPVPKIRRLTKHFNHQHIPISSEYLQEKIDVMRKTYGLSSEVVCQVCCFLTYSLRSLSSILHQYTMWKDKGVFPWDLTVFLSNPCVQNQQIDTNISYFFKRFTYHMDLFQSKLELSNKCCQDTLICLLLEKNNHVFESMLVKIEMLNKHFPVEEIITPNNIEYFKNIKPNLLIKGLQLAETLPEFSISHLEKFIFRQHAGISKLYQHQIVGKMLNLPKDYKKVEKMIQIEAQDVEANIKLLENYGFLRWDIQKLFIVVYADTEKLKHQLDILSSRPEILENNLQVTSFKALNYVQYFLEFEHKGDGFDQSNTFKMDDENDNDDFDVDECYNGERDSFTWL